MEPKGSIARGRLGIVGLALALVVGVSGSSPAQPASGVIRLALLPQWVFLQHRGAASNPALREAIEGGVVDRTVFAWQRGVIQRQVLVATKPIRLVPDPEAGALGGRGQFTLGAVRPPTGRAAWTEVEITRSSTGPDDVLVLEIGGERNTENQVLETFRVAEPGGSLVDVPLARSALIAGPGVPVVTSNFEQPLPATMAAQFREEGGMDVLVARSLTWYVRNGGQTTNGPADTATAGAGDWREGDRVFLRISGAALARGLPGLVLGWKDRKLIDDPDLVLPRRSALPLPILR
jgi:hypothetical protein